jgi:hypothetical protein
MQPIGEAELQMPIFFEGVDGQLGLSLELAAAGRCHCLTNAQRFAPLGPSQESVTDIRIMVSAISCHLSKAALMEFFFTL